MAERPESDDNEAIIPNNKEIPSFKKMRYSDPDLKVIIKYNDDDGNEKEKQYDMYSHNLAKMSKFVDTCLSTNMKEKATKEIILECESPELFETALEYLENPIATRAINAEKAMEVIQFYDKYEFVEGIDLCDQLWADLFDESSEFTGSGAPDNFDFLVDAMAMADKLNLSKSRNAGALFFNSLMVLGTLFGSDYGIITFTVEHIKKLHSLFIKRVIECCKANLTDDELKSPLFPEYFVERAKSIHSNRRIRCLRLSDTRCDADGVFLRTGFDDETFTGCQENDPLGLKSPKRVIIEPFGTVSIIITNNCPPTFPGGPGGGNGDWRILCLGEMGLSWTMWTSPRSKNMNIPPAGPWIPVAEHLKGMGVTPSISYFQNIFQRDEAEAYAEALMNSS